MARYTVKQVAGLSGVSVRTLHYYDEIGLLKPADMGANGYRYYDRPELLRLQHILFHRALGMPLAEIQATLDDAGFDRVEALKAHRRRLCEERDRFSRLIRTIDETLQDLSGAQTMLESTFFEGFSPEKQAEYENDLIDSFGEEAREKITGARQRAMKLSGAVGAAAQAEGEAVNRGLAARIELGDTPGSAEVQALVGRHYKWVCLFWTPDRQAYTGLGHLYLDHPDFRAYYDRYDPRLVGFLAEAMRLYAEANLK